MPHWASEGRQRLSPLDDACRGEKPVAAYVGTFMKRVAALAIAGLVLAPIAHAQTVCEDVGRISASGLYRFDSIKGAQATDEPEDELYESSATLFGSENCLIDQYFEPRHGCIWEFDAETELLAAYVSKTTAVAPCFEGWERRDLRVSDPEETYRVLAGVGYLGADEFEVIVWEIIADFDPGREAGSRYRLSMTAIDYS